eukprot:CAMPEP_0114017384 /NCGR_PEP_ID=MMETSP0372-20130328/14545_1 /TAXON_ID=340204 /ORGANISM="Lankesteria abbotti" /LENGTH=41 /assembly_acc=CAM_ASM_000359
MTPGSGGPGGYDWLADNTPMHMRESVDLSLASHINGTKVVA